MTAAEKDALLHRLERAEMTLRREADRTPLDKAERRYLAKAEGLALAASYVREIEVTE